MSSIAAPMSVSSVSRRSTSACCRSLKLNAAEHQPPLHQTKDGAPRSISWTMALRIPQQSEAFHTLNLGRVDAHLLEFVLDEVGDLAKTTRERRAVQRVWSCLMQHEARLQHVPFAPFVCVAASRGFPTNPLCCFETVLYFLHNLCADWLSAFPSPPQQQLVALDRHFKGRSPRSSTLWSHLNQDILQCSAHDYLWLPMQSFFLFSFNDRHWLQVFDDIVTRTDGTHLFYAVAIALVESRHEKLMRCHTREEVITAVMSPLCDTRAVEELCANARSFCMQIPISLKPITPITSIPESKWYYGVLTIGVPPPAPMIPVDRRDFLSRINVEEEQLLRRLANDVNSIRVASEVARFHRGVHAVLQSDPAIDSQAARFEKNSGAAALREMLPNRRDDCVPDKAQVAVSPTPRRSSASATVGVASSAAFETPLPPVFTESTRGASSTSERSDELHNQTSKSQSQGRSPPLPHHVKKAAALLLASEILQTHRQAAPSATTSSNGTGVAENEPDHQHPPSVFHETCADDVVSEPSFVTNGGAVADDTPSVAVEFTAPALRASAGPASLSSRASGTLTDLTVGPSGGGPTNASSRSASAAAHQLNNSRGSLVQKIH